MSLLHGSRRLAHTRLPCKTLRSTHASVAAALPNASLVGVPGSRERLVTPALVLDLDRLEANIAKMAAHARRVGLALRPHAKTHKSLRIARLQAAASRMQAQAA